MQNFANLEQNGDGIYGVGPCFLTRMVNNRIQTIIGYKGPFSDSIMVTGYKGEAYTEMPRKWWENEGFAITDSAGLEYARQLSWAKKDSKPVPDAPFKHIAMSDEEYYLTMGSSDAEIVAGR